jgi:site-specific recombinase XerD
VKISVYYNKIHRNYFGRFKREDGSYKSVHVPVSCSTKLEAEAWIKANYELITKSLPTVANPPIVAETLTTLFPWWISYLKGARVSKGGEPMAESTIARYESSIRCYALKHHISTTDVNKLSIVEAIDFIEFISLRNPHKKSLAKFTVRNVVNACRAMIHDLRKKGKCTLILNPFDDRIVRDEVPNARTVAGKGIIIHLNSTQVCQLVSSDHAAIPLIRKVRNLFALATGLRKMEIQGLSFAALNLNTPIPCVNVVRQLVRPGTFKQLKTVESTRVVPIHSTLLKALVYWRDFGFELWVGRKPLPEDAVFPNYQGEYCAPDVPLSFRKDLAIVGLPTLYLERFAFDAHSMRRSFLSMLLEASVEEGTRSMLAGHASKSLADKHYVARSLPLLRDAVERLPLPTELVWIPNNKLAVGA